MIIKTSVNDDDAIELKDLVPIKYYYNKIIEEHASTQFESFTREYEGELKNQLSLNIKLNEDQENVGDLKCAHVFCTSHVSRNLMRCHVGGHI